MTIVRRSEALRTMKIVDIGRWCSKVYLLSSSEGGMSDNCHSCGFSPACKVDIIKVLLGQLQTGTSFLNYRAADLQGW